MSFHHEAGRFKPAHSDVIGRWPKPMIHDTFSAINRGTSTPGSASNEASAMTHNTMR